MINDTWLLPNVDQQDTIAEVIFECWFFNKLLDLISRITIVPFLKLRILDFLF